MSVGIPQLHLSNQSSASWAVGAGTSLPLHIAGDLAKRLTAAALLLAK